LNEFLIFIRCVNYGVLPHDEAERLFEKVTKRKRKQRLGGGAASPSPVKKKKKKAKVLKEEAVDPEMQVSSGEAIGRASL
jgi:hypothetical protein